MYKTREKTITYHTVSDSKIKLPRLHAFGGYPGTNTAFCFRNLAPSFGDYSKYVLVFMLIFTFLESKYAENITLSMFLVQACIKHRGKTVFRITCANVILVNKAHNYKYFNGVAVLQKLLIKRTNKNLTNSTIPYKKHKIADEFFAAVVQHEQRKSSVLDLRN